MSVAIVWGNVGRRLENKPLLIRYLQKSTIYINECWIYNRGSETTDGYTRIVVDKQVIGVHRLSAYIYLELDLDNSNQQANHKDICPNKKCWNPNHLYTGTHKDNIQDYLRSGHYNSKKTHCKRGHILRHPGRNGKRRCIVCQYLADNKMVEK